MLTGSSVGSGYCWSQKDLHMILFQESVTQKGDEKMT